MRLRHLAAAAAAALAIVPRLTPSRCRPARSSGPDLLPRCLAAKEKSFAAESPRADARLRRRTDRPPRAMERWELALVYFEGRGFSGNNHTQPEFFEEAGCSTPCRSPFALFGRRVRDPGASRLSPPARARIVRMGGVPIREARSAWRSSSRGRRSGRDTRRPLSHANRGPARDRARRPDGSEVGIEFEMPSGQRVTERLGVAPGPIRRLHRLPASPASSQARVRIRAARPRPPLKLPPHVQPPDEFTSLSLAGGRSSTSGARAFPPTRARTRFREKPTGSSTRS